MKVLGSILITPQRQLSIADGASWDIPRQSIKTRILKGAKIGDLLWVQEPHAEIKSYRFCPKKIHQMVRGSSPLNLQMPAEIKPYQGQYHLYIHRACDLRRGDSMTTLEIMSLGDAAVRCLVHTAQVDDYLETRKVRA
jgi:hypothetical protein